MQSSIIKMNEPELSSFKLENTSAKMVLSSVFAERQHNYLNELHLFVAHFNYIPYYIVEGRIDCRKANAWFREAYSSEIKKHYYNKRSYNL